MGMDKEKLEEARRLLVEGRAVRIAGRVVRFYPSLRVVADVLGQHPSTTARWAKREGLLSARAEIAAADRAAVKPVEARTLEADVSEVLALVVARMKTRRRALSREDLSTIARVLACVAGTGDASRYLLSALSRLRKKFDPAHGAAQ